ncbi:MAG: DMT family transporter [Sulfurovum sp.]|nr:DMT family transporter [Sulfurovum sp.]
MVKKEIDWIAVIALTIAMMVWASSFIALKSTIGPMGPMSVIFGRMVVASLCFVFFIKSFMKLRFTKEDIKYLALMVVFEPCLYFLFEANALVFTTAGQAGMIASTMPLLTAIGAGILLKELISKKLIIGSLIALAGVVWLSLSATSEQNASNPLLGNTLMFFAMICGSGYAISIRHLTKRFSPLFLTALQAFIGVIFFLSFALWEYNTMTIDFNKDAILWIVYLGVVVTLGGYGLFNFALSRIEASKASMFINLIPIFTLLLAFVILGEMLTFVEMIASSIVFLGVLITQIPTKYFKVAK